MVAERAEDFRLAAWWKIMAASALLVQWAGRDLAAAISPPRRELMSEVTS